MMTSFLKAKAHTLRAGGSTFSEIAAKLKIAKTSAFRLCGDQPITGHGKVFKIRLRGVMVTSLINMWRAARCPVSLEHFIGELLEVAIIDWRSCQGFFREPRPRLTLTSEQIRKLRELAGAGLSQELIAKKLDCNQSTISRALSKHAE
jgi:DNA invertase Pin-like site-specific DNA recombinase